MKKLNKRKIVLTMGSLAAMVTPVALAVSCDNNNPELFKWTKNNEWKQTAAFKRANLVVTQLKTYYNANKSKYPELDWAKIHAISINDLKKYSSHEKTEKAKLAVQKNKTLENVNKFFVDFAFKNNYNKAELLEIISFVKESSLSVFSMPSTKWGSYRKGRTITNAYYRRDLGFELRTFEDGEYNLFESSPAKNNGGFDTNLNVFSSLGSGDDLSELRSIDQSFADGNAFAGDMGSNTTFSLIRSYYEDEDIISSDGKTWTKNKKLVKKLAPGFKISADGGSTWTDDLEDATFVAALKNSNNNQIRFKYAGTNNLTYAKVGANNTVLNTSEQFKAKDLFYGFVRNLYTIKEVRDKGTIAGEATGLTAIAADAEAALETEMKEHIPDNNNGYLFNLYNIDLSNTITSNQNEKKDEFIVQFKTQAGSPITQTALNFFTNTSSFVPVPKNVIDQRTATWNNAKIAKTDPSVVYGILNYGNNIVKQSVLSLKDMDTYSLAPYLRTSHDITDNNGVILKLNKFYSDPIVRDSSKHFIETFNVIQKAEGIDASAFNISRKANYIKGALHEYILNKEVYTDSSLMNEIKSKDNLVVLIDAIRNDTNKNKRINYSVWGYKDTDAYNAKARELIWGYSKISDIDKNNDAIENFFTGKGADFRASINGAINWYTVAQGYFPREGYQFHGLLLEEDSLSLSNITINEAKPSFLSDNKAYSDIYNNNRNDIIKQYLAPNFHASRKLMNTLADSVKATKNDPIKVELFDYSFQGMNPKESVTYVNKAIIFILNKMTDGKIIFSFKKKETWTWSQFIKKSLTQSDAFVTFSAYGPDYDGAGSQYQQFLGQYGTNLGVDIMRKILKP